MNENIHLVSDLALILISAGIVTVIFKLLKQPLVLGYIVAGFLVGPHFTLFPTVIEQSSVSEWSEIGIIFLLFGLGLEFSFKRLFKVGSTAFVSAATEIIAMICIGFLTGYLMGWSTMESIFLGGMLSMSSTTIIIKAFEDLGLKKEKFADITMVILILQDLVAIVMMVLLSTAAVSQHFAGMEILESVLKLLFFMILWFVVGISVIPTFFRKADRFINDETLLIISIGLCFGMVVFANYVGFSSALGAFVMGSILSETIRGEHIEKLVKSIKDLFGAIFFVSVGMMVEPSILVEYWLPILILTFITLVVKGIVSTGGVIIAGESLNVSLKTGFSLAQIGEFAFIIAALGGSLGVLRPFIYPVIVAVSVITTFTTPYCIRLATPTYNFLNHIIPQKIKTQMDNYKIGGVTVIHNQIYKEVIKASFVRTAVFAVLSFFLIIFCFNYFYPFMIEHLADQLPRNFVNVINAAITILILAPLLYGLMTNSSKVQTIYMKLWKENRFNRSAIVAWSLLRIFVAQFFLIVVLSKCFKFTNFVLVIIALVMVIFILFSRNVLNRYMKLEENFITNLNAKENASKKENDYPSELDE